MGKQLFIINQDRDRIYPLKKEFVHPTIEILEDGEERFAIRLSGLLLGTTRNMKQTMRVLRMIKNFDGRDGTAFHMPGFCNYDDEQDMRELIDMYDEIEARQDSLDGLA